MVYVGSSWVELDYWSDSTGYGYEVRWRVLAKSSQNITTNESRIDFKLQKRVTGGSAYNYSNLDFRITGTGGQSDSHSATQTWQFGSVSDTSWTDVGGDTSDMYWSGVKHNNDGTCSISATASGDRWNGGTFSTGISIQLPTIARASVPSVSPNPITLSSASNTITVQTNRKASSFTHSITCTIGSFTQTKTSIGTSTTFDIPKTVLASFLATSKTLSGTISCTTFSGATNIGTKSISFSAQIDTTQEHPNIGTVTITDTNPYSAAIEAPGSFIRKASDLSVSIPLTVSGSYTELATATVTCGNVVQNYVLSGTSQTITFTYNKIDTNGLSIVVADKRGTTVTETKTWNLVPYLDLTVTATADRETETGNTIVYRLTGDCFAGSFGLQTNQITSEYRYKLHSSSTYGAWTTIETFTPTGNGEETFDRSGTLSGFSYDQQYDIQFRVTDLFTTAESRELVLTKGIPVYGNGEDFFAVYGDLYIHDRTDPTDYWKLTPTSHVGQVQEADWIAQSNPAIDTAMTDPLTLEAGTYIVTFKRAYTTSAQFSMNLEVGGSYENYRYGGQGDFFTGVLTVAQQTTIVVKSTQSAACSFSYLERGYLKAVKII